MTGLERAHAVVQGATAAQAAAHEPVHDSGAIRRWTAREEAQEHANLRGEAEPTGLLAEKEGSSAEAVASEDAGTRLPVPQEDRELPAEALDQVVAEAPVAGAEQGRGVGPGEIQ